MNTLIYKKKNFIVKTLFLILSPTVYFVFLDCSIVKLLYGDFPRLQLLITLSFAMTKYKLQDETLDNIIANLKC